MTIPIHPFFVLDFEFVEGGPRHIVSRHEAVKHSLPRAAYVAATTSRGAAVAALRLLGAERVVDLAGGRGWKDPPLRAVDLPSTDEGVVLAKAKYRFGGAT